MGPTNSAVSPAQHVRPPLLETSSTFPSLASVEHNPTRTTSTITTHNQTVNNTPPHLPPAPQPAHAQPRLRHRHLSQPRRSRYISSLSIFILVDQRTLNSLGKRKRECVRAAYGRDDTQHSSISVKGYEGGHPNRPGRGGSRGAMYPLLDARSRQEHERTRHGTGKRARGMVLVKDAHAATSGARHSSQSRKGRKED